MIRCLRIGALIATLLTGCTSDSPVDNAVDAAVGIRASGCGLVDRLGTGAVVDAGDRTLIVTSAHTVAGSGTITVERLGQRSAVDLLALDPARDLALLAAPANVLALPFTRLELLKTAGLSTLSRTRHWQRRPIRPTLLPRKRWGRGRRL